MKTSNVSLQQALAGLFRGAPKRSTSDILCSSIVSFIRSYSEVNGCRLRISTCAEADRWLYTPKVGLTRIQIDISSMVIPLVSVTVPTCISLTGEIGGAAKASNRRVILTKSHRAKNRLVIQNKSGSSAKITLVYLYSYDDCRLHSSAITYQNW